ncbi:MAG TPA: hypothetical protein VGM86_05005 [Thermoanaerobaculia bacterium]|jgi:hypothetical protein
MKANIAISMLLAAALSASAFAQDFHRIELKPSGPKVQGKPLPYTIEVPKDWQARQFAGYPGLWIGPADAKPPEDPRLIWVRGSQVPLDEPEKVVANVKTNDEKDPTWSAPRVEIREVGGVRGVLIQTLSGEKDKERGSLTFKVPLVNVSLDFIGSAPAAELPKMLPLYERILLSVRPAEPATAKKP